MQKLLLASTLVLVSACGGGGGDPVPHTNSTVATYHRVAVAHPSYTVQQVAVGDLNQDGLEDVVIGGWQGGNVMVNLTILIQNANGTLTERTSEYVSDSSYYGSQRLYIADFDNDGNTDIFVPGWNENCTVTPGCGVRSFFLWGTSGQGQMLKQELPEYHGAHGACVNDLNKDGLLDFLVRGVYDPVTQSESGGGAYINNGNRSFTVNPNVLVGATCSVIHDVTTGDIAILTSNVHQAEGMHVISIYDSALNWKYNIGVAGHNAPATDLIGSTVLDDNGDGHLDFVLVFNDYVHATPGAKEVWRWTAANTWTYSTTIDKTFNNQYYTIERLINGIKTVYFGTSAGLYQYANGIWTLYKQSRFTDLARTISGASDFNNGAIYQNSNTGKTYILLRLPSGNYYTQEL